MRLKTLRSHNIQQKVGECNELGCKKGGNVVIILLSSANGGFFPWFSHFFVLLHYCCLVFRRDKPLCIFKKNTAIFYLIIHRSLHRLNHICILKQHSNNIHPSCPFKKQLWRSHLLIKCLPIKRLNPTTSHPTFFITRHVYWHRTFPEARRLIIIFIG